MDPFQQCVEDLGTIDRLLELPHGRDIAVEMFREASPYLELLSAMKERDRTGGISRVLEYAAGIRRQLSRGYAEVQKPAARSTTDRVA